MRRQLVLLMLVLAAGHANSFGRGVSPYLPLHLEPEIERQVERALILADVPVMTRPIAAATVLDALPKVCERDIVLCMEVRQYLNRFMYPLGLAHASVHAAATSGADTTVPNRHGLRSESAWDASVGLYWQPSDYALVNLSGIAYDDDVVAAGSVISLGFHFAQLDIGYRGHWLSPMSDSSMLLSSEAPTLPSITLSNYAPLTRFGLRYEVFAARMERSDDIVFGDGFTSGHPKIAGLHISAEPAIGWAIGVNRVMQYGGGARGGQSLSDVFDAFFRPSRFDNVGGELTADEQFGNQVASFTSVLLFPGRTPFSVYFEYAGEDTSRGRDYLLGNSALSAGIRFPQLWSNFDLTYETSEWQNGWYVHHIYQEGLTNDGRVLGHWGADQRVFNDGVGAQTHMLSLGWRPSFGGAFEFRYRTVRNESYSSIDYERGWDGTIRYSRPLGQFTVGAEAFAGRDVFGEDFSRIGAFFRYAEHSRERGRSLYEAAVVEQDGAEIFVEAGVNAHEVRIDLDDSVPRTTTDVSFAPRVAIGARRAVSERSDLGARLEIDEIDGHTLIGVRALDYRYRFRNPLALTFFVGAARYDLESPAYGLLWGFGAQWRDLLPGWDVGVDLRVAMKVARDNLLPTDIQGGRGDSFYDVNAVTATVTRRF
jgi:hypothetical protein